MTAGPLRSETWGDENKVGCTFEAGGDSDAEVRNYLVDRYGEFVLLKPVFSMANAALWIAGPLLFVLGLIVSIFYVRSRKPAQPEALSAEEQAEMDRILKG